MLEQSDHLGVTTGGHSSRKKQYLIDYLRRYNKPSNSTSYTVCYRCLKHSNRALFFSSSNKYEPKEKCARNMGLCGAHSKFKRCSETLSACVAICTGNANNTNAPLTDVTTEAQLGITLCLIVHGSNVGRPGIQRRHTRGSTARSHPGTPTTGARASILTPHLHRQTTLWLLAASSARSMLLQCQSPFGL